MLTEYRDLRKKLLSHAPDKRVTQAIETAFNKGTLHPVIHKLIEDIYQASPIKCKRALVIEGGGVSSVVASFSSAALEFLGWYGLGVDIKKYFYVVGGSSGGAAIAAKFACSQSIHGALIYSRSFAGPPFLNSPFNNSFPYINWSVLKQIMKGQKKIVNIQYLIDMFKKMGLELPNTSDHFSPKLAIYATEIKKNRNHHLTERAVLFDSFQTLEELLNIIQASTHIPALSGRSVSFNGRNFFDGAFTKPIPLKEITEKYNCSQALLLSNFPSDYTSPKLVFFEKLLATIYGLLFDSGAISIWLRRSIEDNNARVWISHKVKEKSLDPLICVICPKSEKRLVPPFESDPQKIEKAGIEGAKSLFTAFGIEGELQKELIDELIQSEADLANLF